MSQANTPLSPDTRDYDALPLSIRSLYTFDQYLWLSDDEKGRLLQTETEPETYP